MVKKEWAFMYFNDEWNEPNTDNDGGDEDVIDGVDFPNEASSNSNSDYDWDGGYEEYGNQHPLKSFYGGGGVGTLIFLIVC